LSITHLYSGSCNIDSKGYLIAVGASPAAAEIEEVSMPGVRKAPKRAVKSKSKMKSAMPAKKKAPKKKTKKS